MEKREGKGVEKIKKRGGREKEIDETVKKPRKNKEREEGGNE